MLLPSEYNRLILAEREAAGRVAALLRQQTELDGLDTRYVPELDGALTVARRRLNEISRLLDYNAGATTEDVARALAASHA